MSITEQKKALLQMIKYHFAAIEMCDILYFNSDITDWYLIYDYHMEKIKFF